MFFLLRCAFWLLIVYATILLPHHLVRDVIDETADASSAAVAQVTHKAMTSAADYCGRSGAKCLDQATRLTSLIERTQVSDAGPAPKDTDVISSAPMPVARPRNISQDVTRGVRTNR